MKTYQTCLVSHLLEIKAYSMAVADNNILLEAAIPCLRLMSLSFRTSTALHAVQAGKQQKSVSKDSKAKAASVPELACKLLLQAPLSAWKEKRGKKT